MEYQNNSNFEATTEAKERSDIQDERPKKKPSELRTKKRSLGSKIHDTFIKGDVTEVMKSIGTEFVIPYILSGVKDVCHSFIDGMLSGDDGGYYYGYSGSGGKHTAYNKMGKKGKKDVNKRTNAAKKSKVMDDVLFDSRGQAEVALKILRDELNDGHHDCVSIVDFYDAYEEATGECIDHDFSEAKYGWFDLDNIPVMRTRDDSGVAYYIKFPPAELLE